MDQSRTEALLGTQAVERLASSRVIVFGIGGVGGSAAEALARAGIGRLTFVDPDRVAESNLNRQIVALRSTLGLNKAEAMAARVRDINPDCDVTALPLFYGEDTKDTIDLRGYDFIIDAIDTVPSKILLITEADRIGVPVISAMGAGNKLDPTAFRVADLSKTSVCPLAKIMRRELKQRGILHVPVVYSEELPAQVTPPAPERHFIGSVSFVPPAAGFALAGYVIRRLCGYEK